MRSMVDPETSTANFCKEIIGPRKQYPTMSAIVVGDCSNDDVISEQKLAALLFMSIIKLYVFG